jgi:predicted transcriptional regulator of viral defense system
MTQPNTIVRDGRMSRSRRVVLPTSRPAARVGRRMASLAPFLANRCLLHVEDVDHWLRAAGKPSVAYRDRLLSNLCAAGVLVRIQRGLYANAASPAQWQDPYQLPSWIVPDAVLAGRTALEIRCGVPRSQRYKFCVFFTRMSARGTGPAWQGVSMRAIAHPVALVREGQTLIETDQVDNNSGRPLYVTTIERAFVDLLERPRLNGKWQDLLSLIGAIPALDLDRTVRYLKQLGNATTAAKAGWLLERHEEQFAVSPSVLTQIQRLRPRGPHYLSRTHRESGRYLARWNLVVPAELLKP